MIKIMKKVPEKKGYKGCRSWRCKECSNYVKFLSGPSMRDLCWNKRTFFEKKESKKCG